MPRKVTVIPAKAKEKVSTPKAATVRVAAYCRVSTDLEDQLGSFQNQVENYTNLIRKTPGWTMAGIFADEGVSGTGTKKRSGFMDMIKACEEGRVDLVITKSISRFARNTADSLIYCRRLKALGIPIIFEKESINTLEASGELMFTILSSLAQEESRNISENTAWGIRSKFQQGIPHINCESLLGYDKDDNGNLIINEEQAAIVRRIYRDYLEGWQPTEIARHLNEEGVPGVHGNARWHSVTVTRMLQNEKHCGDLLMQKTYTADFLTKIQTENNGDLEQYFIKDDHPAIVSREQWDAVQLEMKRREEYYARHNIRTLASSIDDPFYSRVFCGETGRRYLRHDWKGNKEAFWKIETSSSAKPSDTQPPVRTAETQPTVNDAVTQPSVNDIAAQPSATDASTQVSANNTAAQPSSSKVDTVENKKAATRIPESVLQAAVVTAWNEIVASRDTLLPIWKRALADGDALEKYYAQMMIDITADGPLERFCPELVRLMLDEVIINGDEIVVRFKDGSFRQV